MRRTCSRNLRSNLGVAGWRTKNQEKASAEDPHWPIWSRTNRPIIEPWALSARLRAWARGLALAPAWERSA